MDASHRLVPSDFSDSLKADMQVLTSQEIDMVSGGDSWAGTPEGREPVPVPETFIGCVERESGMPGVSESSAIISCGAQKIYEWLMQY
ncbi:hypothetical protein ACQ859_26805 [Roseateles chitinivorans]|uniref:hypothetical protein n=1 Tax=Roseateles chitinivorans TaxID=2917965 RepID=UPI003D669A79